VLMLSPLEVEFRAPTLEEAPEYISATEIPGLYTIRRPVYADNRGDFWEIARIPDIEAVLGRPFAIKQLNRSRNESRGTLRGIHVADWDKLITVIRGAVFIALIDFRKGSPTFGKQFTATLGDGQTQASVLIPAGFGNSYQTLADRTDYMYAVTDLWSPGREIGIRWNDKDLGIDWPVTPPIISEKDDRNAPLSEYFPDFVGMVKG
jgi:dTDP-4-dehydrorhamnose 3,5-epimerase